MFSGSENDWFDVDLLLHHPKNPRKDLGDLEELTKSIKLNGIMQNLTVIPARETQFDVPIMDLNGKYVVLIGNRRFEAAKAAGIKKLPCNVVYGLSHAEQVSIMLEENMQRSDLTIIEQAKGFQMMLDLGESVEDIEKKTGFSESTIRHRVKLAELDEKILGDAIEGKQITLTNLIKLEKIESVEKRNELLKKKNLSDWAIEGAVEEEKADKLAKEWVKALQKEYLAEVLPSDAKVYDGTWKVIYSNNGAKGIDELQVSDFPKERLYVSVSRYEKKIYVRCEPEAKKDTSELDAANEKCSAIRESIQVMYKHAVNELDRYLCEMIAQEAKHGEPCLKSYNAELALDLAYNISQSRWSIDFNSVEDYIEQAIEYKPAAFENYEVMIDGEEVNGKMYSFEGIKEDLNVYTKLFIMLMSEAVSDWITDRDMIDNRAEKSSHNSDILSAYEYAKFDGLNDKDKDVFLLKDDIFDTYKLACDRRNEIRGRV